MEDELKKPKKKPPQMFSVGKSLTRSEALTKAKKKATRDFRGFFYNPKNGVVILT